jgi:hypothetical protein
MTKFVFMHHSDGRGVVTADEMIGTLFPVDRRRHGYLMPTAVV